MSSKERDCLSRPLVFGTSVTVCGFQEVRATVNRIRVICTYEQSRSKKEVRILATMPTGEIIRAGFAFKIKAKSRLEDKALVGDTAHPLVHEETGACFGLVDMVNSTLGADVNSSIALCCIEGGII